MKKAYYFSIDAIVAATLLMTGLLLASTLFVQESEITTVQYYSQDLMNILSSAKIYEFNSTAIQQLILSGKIDPNKTVIDQAAQLWAEGNTTLANSLLSATVDIVPEQFRLGLYFDDEYISGKNNTEYNKLVSSKRLISGIAKGKPVEGFSSKAQLTSFETRKGSSYYYFGGFVGQGNLTIRMVLPNSINVTSAYLEVDTSDNFTLYINGQESGTYEKASSGGGYRLADKWQLNSTYLNNFHGGTNYVNLTFANSLGFIGGGFLKVGYTTADINDTTVQFYQGIATKRYYFPRIDGLVNLFDSFFVPGQIQTLSAYIHYKSDFNTFLNIENITVFADNNPEEQEIHLTNGLLDSLLNYTALSEKTTPLRLGASLEGNQSITQQSGGADVVLVNDLSGSMEWCAQNACSTTRLGPASYCGTNANYRPEVGSFCNWSTEEYNLQGFGQVCSGRWHGFCPANDTRKIDVAINASDAFTSILLGSSDNRLGLVGYSNSWPYTIPNGGTWTDRFAAFPDGIVSAVNLTTNATKLQNDISLNMDSYWGTCICCGVRRAREIISNESNNSRFRSIVVMSDGEATDKCTGVGIGNAKDDAINEAQDACNNHNISVSTVAFGQDADAETLKAMVCNDGIFYNASDVDDLISTYTEIATKINNITYSEQVVNVSGGAGAGILYEDSYIEYNYTPSQIMEFGVIPAILESQRFGNNISQTDLNLPAGLELSEVRVTSYSAETWTNNLTISNSIPNQNAFSLSGDDYLNMGDPFVVYAPANLFESGSNLVHISSGSNAGNSTGGSADNVVIYTLLIPNTVPEKGVFSNADGCVWHVMFEDGSNLSLAIPGSYSGSENCSFYPESIPSDDAVDDAVLRLLSLLDFDNNGLLDVKFDENELDINFFTKTKVPSLWGPTVAEVRVWQ